MAIEVRWGSATHVGRVRASNQDATLAGPIVFAVADGMGGHAAGDVASTLAVGSLAQLDSGATADELVDAVRQANAVILRESAPGSGREGMGTTVTGVCLGQAPDGDVVVVFNVGDSRTYRHAGGSFHQLTEDHSLVAEMVRDGEISDDEAASHPSRNVVTRALGLPGELEVDHWAEAPVPGTSYLMCSDGLSNEVSAVALHDVLAGDGEPQVKADALVELALAAGARDNVSVVIVTVDGVTEEDRALEEDTNPRGATNAARANPPPIDEVPGAEGALAPVPPETNQEIGSVPGATTSSDASLPDQEVISEVPGVPESDDSAAPAGAGELVTDVPSASEGERPDRA